VFDSHEPDRHGLLRSPRDDMTIDRSG